MARLADHVELMPAFTGELEKTAEQVLLVRVPAPELRGRIAE